MKNHPLLPLVALAVFALVAAGVVFMSNAASSSSSISPDSRTPALVGGITCLLIATGLLLTGLFLFRPKQ